MLHSPLDSSGSSLLAAIDHFTGLMPQAIVAALLVAIVTTVIVVVVS